MKDILLPKFKPQIFNLGEFDTRKGCRFSIPSPKLDSDVYITTRIPQDDEYKIITEITDKNSELLGFEEMSYFPGQDFITGLFIRTTEKYNQNNFRFGEILRLSSIINMFENKVNSIKICSKDKAVYFHSKYKFQPDNKRFDIRDRILRFLKNNTQDQVVLSEIETIEKSLANNPDASIQRQHCKEVNSLVEKFLEEILKTKGNYKAYPFPECIDMVLTKENIIKNRDFFNKLFEQHKIKYSIPPAD